MKVAYRTARATALKGFTEKGADHLNCAQAVVLFAVTLLGSGEDDVVLARYFGGGMSRMGEVCGALSGSALSLGLRDRHRGLSWPDGASPDTEKLQQLFRDFEAEFGALTCRGLVGYATDTPDGYRRFNGDDKYASCVDYVSWACDHLYALLETSS